MLDFKLKHEKEVLGEDVMFGLLDTSLSVGKCLAAVTHKITEFLNQPLAVEHKNTH